MAGITGKSFVALYPLWSLKKKMSVLTILTYHNYFLTSTATAFLNYSKFAIKNKILPFQKLLRG